MPVDVRLFKVAMNVQSTFSMSANPYYGADEAVREVLLSGYIGQGPKVEAFEDALRDKLGLRARPVTTNSCTSAIDLALELIGVGPGDYVITTPQTCTATNSPAVKRGATLLWADVDPETGLIDPESVHEFMVASAFIGRIKAVIAVDWAGRLADYAALRHAAPGIPIIQDAAHRLPDGTPGGDYVAWSFQAIKFLTTGDGGALITPPEQEERARLLRWYGLDRTSDASFRCAQNIQEVGFKYHMNDIAAAIGLANLGLAMKNLTLHRMNAAWLAEKLDVPFDEDGHYWFFPLVVPERDAYIQQMAAEGIEAGQVHARNDTHDAFRRVSPFPAGPGTDYFDAHQVAIPCGWWLTQDDLDRIVRAHHLCGVV